MNFILLEPGDPGIVGAEDDRSGTLADGLAVGPCIELVSLHQGMKQQITTDVSNAARTSGRPIITEYTCVKHIDGLSLTFYDHCLRAKPLGQGAQQPTRLHLCRTRGTVAEIVMTIALRDALIGEIQMQATSDGVPTEQFKLHFTEILWTYAAQRDGARTATPPSAGWSVARNRPIAAFTH